MKMTVREAMHALQGRLILGDPRTEITGACIDSRHLEPNCLFFALKGERVDGHDFALSAARQGAAGVVVSRMDWLKGESKLAAAVIEVKDTEAALKALAAAVRRSFKGPVVGVTGSNGKTTTKEMVSSVLRTRGRGLSTSGNYNSQLGLPIVLSRLTSEDRWIVLEMGASAPGNIAGLCEIGRPTVGIITSIGPAHLETFGSLANIAKTKWELMESLPDDGVAIVPWGESLLEKHVRAFKKKIVFFGEDPLCPVRASQIDVSEKISFRLHLGAESEIVHLPLPGRYNVGNALAAAAAGWSLGYSLADIAKGLEGFQPPKMRMEVLRSPTGAMLINDAYNANPASMLHAVHALMESFPNQRKVVVLGSMLELGGDSDRYHFHVGTEVGRCALNRIFLYGAEAKQIFDGAISAGAPADRVVWSATPDELAAAVRREMTDGTVILFKGSRGMQLENVIRSLTAAEQKEKAH
ncbi:MAG: UDP-N-acetylmuramoyl-tripeptide--D-alanyl-D-alanine ligase [Elusimicrobia bacterium]|nr:UDP-N-acetylmuramoyl-tripeptide--D-alanyl-D-alanine ligase [Elusimicrobiota bacterium]